ncbi:hypothetical protein IFM89_031836 [Coptis chinensis]|uniref:Protein SCAR n=1 Tax=Coptis chinensis TaxID=261450 RepID=A0A835H093_9MAGN|nr:hypothetical protein IFM89_031836 [Coptis chinensis]
MPLVRFEVRNEYGLGSEELYREVDKDDTKDVLDGIAVAGLVGVLRQLGDLAEFAAEVFHDLQEQAMATASRSHKMTIRVQHIEAALPPLEKAVFSQTNHLHFAYTDGLDWHPNLNRENIHIVQTDLPSFIMDSYEECRDPPSLHLLDKFDIGGPGACLKRYSDPSFFKRALPSSEVQLEKKVHQSKKKRVQQRNIGIPRAELISQLNGRMQFTSPIVSEQNSVSRTISVSRSELGDRSISFESRSDYIECVLEANHCMPQKEQESFDDTLGSICLHEQNGGANDVLPSQENKVVNSSSVTWHEKTEILKPTIQSSNNIVEDQRRISELTPVTSNQDKLESEVVRLDNAVSDDVMSYNVKMLKPLSDGNLSEEVDSESENYMDALNMTASEIETDAEKQSKMEVQIPCTNFRNNGTDCGIGTTNAMTAKFSDLFTVEPCTEPVSQYLSNSCQDSVLPKLPQIIGMCSDTNLNIDTSITEVSHLHDPRVNGCRPTTSDPLSSSFSITSSLTSPSENTSSVHNPREFLVEVSDRSSIRLWTNGGLLGLEPSKPPDISVPDSANQNLAPIVKTNEPGLSSDCVTPESHFDGPPRQLATPVETSEPSKNLRSEGGHDKKENFMSVGSSIESSTSSKAMLGKSKGSLCYDNFSKANGHGLPDTGVTNLGCDLAFIPDVSESPKEPSQDTKVSSSSMFFPRLLVNGFQKKVSLAHDDTSKPSCIVKTDLSEHLRHASPTNSIPSSPPLEHMKISYHPIDGFEMSKMKLKFHDGHYIHDNNKDAEFPSFQLLPQSVYSLQDFSFESDDDTFSRSSEYMSDELLSELSESNSEQWTCGKAPGNEDNEIYNALSRVPSSETISRSSEFEGIDDNGVYPDGDYEDPDANGVQPSYNGSLNSLPVEKDMGLVLQFSVEAMPPPPPLPPVQWRAVKQHLENEQFSISDVSTNQHSEQVPAANTCQQPHMSTPKQQMHIEETNPCPPESKNRVQDFKNMDEKEDFLHQIRTKSLSLKRTVSARPTAISGPFANIKVTAILQKANEIRQAFVGSDEEDSDNWSDG